MCKEDVKVPETFRAAWDEIRDCYFRVKIGKAKIVTAQGKDGREYRYTEHTAAES